MMQIVSQKVLMVRPRSFRPNDETAKTNAFQRPGGETSAHEILLAAQHEFDQLRSALERHLIQVHGCEEPAGADTPDALFPNNWFAVLPNQKAFLFPMLALNRRREVHPEWILTVPGVSAQTNDLRSFESENIFLEGTGSMVLDHGEKVIYACLSARTHEKALQKFSELSGYSLFYFEAVDAQNLAYYHTNVMMALSESTAIICLESIKDANSQETLRAKLLDSGRNLVEISREQVLEFAGNLLLLKNSRGEKYWLCSTTAEKSFTPKQRSILESEAPLLCAHIPNIEKIGGGGVRCMLGELF